MKNFIQNTMLLTCLLGLVACASDPSKDKDSSRYQRKIYLTEQDYLDDLDQHAEAERREAKPNTESNYIFEQQPDTQKNVYFFDDRVQPMVPGEPSERDYKKTKRLWNKPRRYAPEQYYANQPEQTEEKQNSSYSYSEYDY